MDPKNKVHNPRPAFQEEIDQALAGGLSELAARELLGLVLSSLGHAERRHFLARNPDDKGNGSYPRSLQLGSLPLAIDVARTRSGGSAPASSRRPTSAPIPRSAENS